MHKCDNPHMYTLCVAILSLRGKSRRVHSWHPTINLPTFNKNTDCAVQVLESASDCVQLQGMCV